MATWLEDITQALVNLGGVASLQDIYNEVHRTRGTPLPIHWQALIRATIEDHSSDAVFRSGKDIFYSPKGIGRGIWGIRTISHEPIVSSDITAPDRIPTQAYRVLRDTALARMIKALHRNRCQICGTAIQLLNGGTYSEAHHIRPLGQPHNGPDVSGNILVLCPNHHVMCDYGAIRLELHTLFIHPNHNLDLQHISYHNSFIVETH
jgi:hypothetical protein